jgi:hypothetical protein
MTNNDPILFVTRDSDPQRHNYVKKLMKMKQAGTIPAESGSCLDVTCSHDDWCQIYKGGYCNCDPDITWKRR